MQPLPDKSRFIIWAPASATSVESAAIQKEFAGPSRDAEVMRICRDSVTAAACPACPALLPSCTIRRDMQKKQVLGLVVCVLALHQDRAVQSPICFLHPQTIK